MTDLPANLFENPVWHALQTTHRHFAVSAGDAVRYPADVAPFAAVATPSTAALRQLQSLLTPGEKLWLTGKGFPRVPELSFGETLPCLQMVLPEDVVPPGPTIEETAQPIHLSQDDASAMVDLTTLAFPGFFRPRTCEMGSYYGVRSDGALIAMCGERLMLDGHPEISGVCTHPAHRGKGLATSLIWQIVRDHRRDGLVSWLHVASGNSRAIELYLRLGFRVVREVSITQVWARNE